MATTKITLEVASQFKNAALQLKQCRSSERKNDGPSVLDLRSNFVALSTQLANIQTEGKSEETEIARIKAQFDVATRSLQNEVERLRGELSDSELALRVQQLQPTEADILRVGTEVRQSDVERAKVLKEMLAIQEKLQRDKEEASNTLAIKEQQNKDLASELKKLKNKSRQALLELKSEQQQEILRLENKESADETIRALRDAQTKLFRCTSELEDAKMRLQTSEQKLIIVTGEKEAGISSANDLVERCKREKAVAVAKFERTARDLNKSTQLLDKKQQQIATLNAEISSFEGDRFKSNAIIDELNAVLVEKDNEIRKLHEEQEGAVNQHSLQLLEVEDRHSTEIFELENEINKLRELAAKFSQKTTQSFVPSDRTSENTHQDATIIAQRGTIDLLKHAQNKLELELEETQVKLNESKANNQSEKDALLEELKRVTTERDDATNNIRETREKLEQTKIKLDDANAELNYIVQLFSSSSPVVGRNRLDIQLSERRLTRVTQISQKINEAKRVRAQESEKSRKEREQAVKEALSFKRRVNEQAQELGQQTAIIATLRQNLDQSNAQYNDKITKLHDDLSRSTKSADDEINKLERRVATLQEEQLRRHSADEQALFLKQAEADLTQTEIQRLKNELEQSSTARDRLQVEFDRINQKLSATSESLDKKLAQLEQCSKAERALNDELSDARRDISTKNSSINRLQRDVAELKRQYHIHDENNSLVTKRLKETFTKHLQRVRDELAVARSADKSLPKLTARIDSLSSELALANEEGVHCRNELQQVRAELLHAQHETSEVQTELTEAETRLELLNKREVENKEEIAALQKENTALSYQQLAVVHPRLGQPSVSKKRKLVPIGRAVDEDEQKDQAALFDQPPARLEFSDQSNPVDVRALIPLSERPDSEEEDLFALTFEQDSQ